MPSRACFGVFISSASAYQVHIKVIGLAGGSHRVTLAYRVAHEGASVGSSVSADSLVVDTSAGPCHCFLHINYPWRFSLSFTDRKRAACLHSGDDVELRRQYCCLLRRLGDKILLRFDREEKIGRVMCLWVHNKSMGRSLENPWFRRPPRRRRCKSTRSTHASNESTRIKCDCARFHEASYLSGFHQLSLSCA